MVWSVDFNSGQGSGDTPPVTTDGTCGLAHGGTICGNWSAGDCCSSAGYCGGDAAHCGNGCQSGNCTVGGQSTDGTCGIGQSGSFCGTWLGGSCCSSAGYCGNDTAHCGAGCQSGCPTTDGTCGIQNNHNVCGDWATGNCCSSSGYCGSDDTYCGIGCQSGPCLAGSSLVFIDPSIWQQPQPTVSCIPPCDLILPPYTLSAPTTINFPPFITTITEQWVNSSSTTSIFTLTFPPIVTTEIPVFNVNITDSSVSSATYSVTPSIFPPPTLITVGPPAGISFPPVTFSATYAPNSTGPWPTVNNEPTSVHFTSRAPPGPTCHIGCGSECLIFCNDCGLFGCGFPHIQGGPPCIGPACGPGGNPSDSSPTSTVSESQSCSTSQTISDCTVYCSTTSVGGLVTTACSSTICDSATTCGGTGTTTTTSFSLLDVPTAIFDDFDQGVIGADISSFLSVAMASEDSVDADTATSPPITSGPTTSGGSPTGSSYISCSTQDVDPDHGIDVSYCVCSGSTFPQSTDTQTPPNSCAYTVLPASTTSISSSQTVTTDLADCQVCTIFGAGPDAESCTSIPNCVSSTSSTSSTTTSSSSSSPTSTPASQAVAVGWITACVADGGGTSGVGSDCTSTWEVFDFAPGGQYNGCQDTPTWASTQTFENGANSPSYPSTLGPFTAVDFTNCAFTVTDSKDPGTITCDGGVNNACSVNTDQGQFGSCKGDVSWLPQYLCLLS